MAFKVKLLLSAQKDLEDAIDYYHQINKDLSERFYSEFLELNSLLEENPYFEVKYEPVRTYKLKSFPYIVHFIVNDTTNLVIIIAIIFGKQEKRNFTDRFFNP